MKASLIISTLVTVCLAAIMLACNSKDLHSIKVIDSESRTAISGAEIEVQLEGKNKAFTVTTDTEGIAHFSPQNWQGHSSTIEVRIRKEQQLLYHYKRLRPADGSMVCVVQGQD